VYSNLRKKKRWGKGGRHLASFGKKKRKGDFGCSSHASRQVLNSDFLIVLLLLVVSRVLLEYILMMMWFFIDGDVVEGGGDDDEGVGER